MKDIQNYSLLKHNTFGIDVKCRRYIEFANIEEAIQVAAILRTANEPFLIIGSGSNLLLTKDFEGIVVHSACQYIKKEDENKVRCGSGVEWDEVIVYCLQNQLYGGENLSIIPGEVGASAVQNIGAYGTEIKDIVEEVEAIEICTGKVKLISNNECEFAYRHSKFKKEWKNKYIITSVLYRFSTTFTPILSYGNIESVLKKKGITNPTATELRNTIIEIRNEKLPDPKILGNAGSFFMNPIVPKRKLEEIQKEYPSVPFYIIDDSSVKIPAAWLIEQCGWKGKSIGKAGVHQNQALVLINKGGATGEDILHLCNAIQEDVNKKLGIVITPEVNIY